MLTLLLPEQQDKIEKEYRLRLIIVALCLLAALFLLIILFLSPSYFLSETKEKAVSDRELLLKKSDVSERAGKANSDLETARTQIKNLSGAFDNSAFSLAAAEVIKEIVSRETLGITIQSFAFSKVVDVPRGKLQVTGISKTRSELVSFLQSIKKIPMFTKVDFPVSNLAKDTDINFSLAVSGNF